MSSQKLYRKKSPASSKSKRQPESPFLDEELFADMQVEAVEAWASRLVGYQLESPFQHAFELEQEEIVKAKEQEVVEPETEESDELDGEVDEEELDEDLADEDSFLSISDEEEEAFPDLAVDES
jgi:hypothetical protein